jgi:hypothetical protein
MERKKIFVSYALEEKQLLDLFIEQSKKESISYDLVYFTDKDPLSVEWRELCKSEIQRCHGVVFMISKYLQLSEGAFWEMKYSHELNKPMISVFVGDAGIRDKPRDLTGVTAMVMSWVRVNEFVEKLPALV